MVIGKIIQTTVSTQSLEEILPCKTWIMMTQTRSGDGALTGGGRAGVLPSGGSARSRNEMGMKNEDDFPVFAVTEV